MSEMMETPSGEVADAVVGAELSETTDAVEAENLFAEFEPKEEAEPEEEAPAEDAEERTLFEALKAKYQPDSPNFKALKESLAAKETSLGEWKAFEPLKAIPNAAESLTKLATGQAEGREAMEIVQQLTTPNVFEGIQEEAFWTYAGNEKNADVIARSLLGGHMTADVLKRVAEATDPAKGWLSIEDLLEDLSNETPDSALTQQQKAERDEWRREAAIKADREQAQQLRVQEETNRLNGYVTTAATEIFEFTDTPIKEIKEKYHFAPSDKDIPQVKALKAEAEELYDALVERKLIASETAQSHLKNIRAMLVQGKTRTGAGEKDIEAALKQAAALKERARAMYGPDLQQTTHEIAVEVAGRVNKWLKPQLEALRKDAGKPATAPKELGSMAASGPQPYHEEEVDERKRIGRAAYQAAITPPSA
jgi:hypothetical protein